MILGSHVDHWSRSSLTTKFNLLLPFKITFIILFSFLIFPIFLTQHSVALVSYIHCVHLCFGLAKCDFHWPHHTPPSHLSLLCSFQTLLEIPPGVQLSALLHREHMPGLFWGSRVKPHGADWGRQEVKLRNGIENQVNFQNKTSGADSGSCFNSSKERRMKRKCGRKPSSRRPLVLCEFYTGKICTWAQLGISRSLCNVQINKYGYVHTCSNGIMYNEFRVLVLVGRKL